MAANRKPRGKTRSFRNSKSGDFKKNGRAFEDTNRNNEKRAESANDWSWYVRSPQLVKDVASISFNNALGAGYTLGEDQTLNTGLVVGKSFKNPGVMAIHTVPTPGASTGAASALNIAAKNTYVWVRHQNSGHANYESTDLMMYLLAMDSVYAWIAHLMRVYGVARVFSQRNRYIGDVMLRACGVDPTNLRSNLANFRASVNMLIVKASAFCTPVTMSLYKRHMWMYSGIYRDSDIDKSQFYLYLPSILYTYKEVTDGPGYLEATPNLLSFAGGGLTRSSAKTASGMISIGENMLAALQQSEDINIMSGDILKAYGRENLNTLAFVPEDYAVAPIYSDEILDQIHNTLFVGAFPLKGAVTPENWQDVAGIDSLHIKQITDSNLDSYISIRPYFKNAEHLSIQHIIDLGDSDPTPERVIVATRNMPAGATTGVNVSATETPLIVRQTLVNNFGSDMCLYADIYNDPVSTATHYQVYTTSTTSTNAPQMNPMLVKFRKHPLVYLGNIADNKWNLADVQGDMDNYTVISNQDLKEMHESAILSQFGVPI